MPFLPVRPEPPGAPGSIPCAQRGPPLPPRLPLAWLGSYCKGFRLSCFLTCGTNSIGMSVPCVSDVPPHTHGGLTVCERPVQDIRPQV